MQEIPRNCCKPRGERVRGREGGDAPTVKREGNREGKGDGKGGNHDGDREGTETERGREDGDSAREK